MKNLSTGILLQGDVRSWTVPIIEEYIKNFPESEILLATWKNEDVSKIPCNVVKETLPKPVTPFNSSKNFQIIGCRKGIKEINADIILKVRTDFFVHNPEIFHMFLEENSHEKIMYPHSGLIKEYREYWITDFCQLSSKETLLEYWDHMPLHDGKQIIAAEEFFTRNYILNTKKDTRPWREIHDEYFIKKRYHEDFQIEFHKYVNLRDYQDELTRASAETNIESQIIYPKETTSD